MRSHILHIILAGSSLFVASCADTGSTTTKTTSKGGGIILGDSSMIVTEADSTYLQDMNVVDYNPKAPTTADVREVSTAKPDTVQATQQVEVAKEVEQPKPEPAEKPKGKGLTIDSKDFAVFISDIAAKGSGTTYQLQSGSLNGKQLRVTEGTIEKISQREQTVVVAKNNLGELVLDNLSSTSDWQPLRGGGSSYTISGLNPGQLTAPKATPNSIRSAVSRAARRKRVGKANEQKWVNSVKNVRSATQRPLSVELRSVMWKIEGKNAKGRSFSKQIRVDMPL